MSDPTPAPTEAPVAGADPALLAILQGILDVLTVIKDRASSSTQGLYMNHVCTTCEDDRALLMASLQRTGDLNDLIDERNNPTPSPVFNK